MQRLLILLSSQVYFLFAVFALTTFSFVPLSFAADQTLVTGNEANVVYEKSDEQIATLFENLANAPTQLDGQLAENAVWQHWFDQSPTPQARALIDAALERREAYDFEAAEDYLDKLIEDEPDYAEAYNQRAFIRFLRENLEESKADLEITLSMEPNHFGAWAGMYHIYIRTGEQEKAFANLVKAVSLHPWLKERGALPKTMWPERYRKIHEPGQDI